MTLASIFECTVAKDFQSFIFKSKNKTLNECLIYPYAIHSNNDLMNNYKVIG